MADIKGTVFARENGKFTALAGKTWDPQAKKYRRPSLGTFATSEEAERARLDYNINDADGVFSLKGIELRKARLDRYLVDWLDFIERKRLAGEITLGTQRDYETVVRLHVVPHLGRRRIGEITPAMVRRWLLDLRAAGVGERTVQKAYWTLHGSLADSDLDVNPTSLPRRQRPQVRERRLAVYPTADQVAAFLEHVGGCEEPYGTCYQALWQIAATTGARRGEVVGLAWPDIDLETGTITVRQTIQIDSGSVYVKGPKSRHGYRTLGIDDETIGYLRRHRIRMLEERAAGADYEVEPLGHDFVFRGDRTGRPVNPDRITDAFKREWAHAGLPPGPTLHGLRHTNGSLLLLNGVPPIQVAAHLGHDLQTLNKVYAHELDPANRQEVIAQAVADIYR